MTAADSSSSPSEPSRSIEIELKFDADDEEDLSKVKEITEDAPIVVRPYSDESVIISGCEPVSGWEVHSSEKGIWKAPMPWTLGLGRNQVFAGGQVMIEARIVEAEDNFNRNLGARLGYNSNAANQILNDGAKILFGGGLAATGWQTGQISTTPNFFTNSLTTNLPSTSITGKRGVDFSPVGRGLCRAASVRARCRCVPSTFVTAQSPSRSRHEGCP